MPLLNEEMQYRVMRLVEANPEITQRDVARELGVSLGKANYSVRALIRKGWVRAIAVKNSHQKAAYSYSLTRLGRQEKSRLTVRFVASKMREYEGLLAEIDQMQRATPRRNGRTPRPRGKLRA
jgi:EPS-associated MarR family transcriptional regulator